MSDPRITDEAVEASARAMYERDFPAAVSLPGSVARWGTGKALFLDIQSTYRASALAALEAAVPLLAPQPVDREALLAVLNEHQAFEIALTTDGGIAGARKKLADAVLALLNGGAS